MARKTLVIGLGGSGCRVAAAVKKMVGGKDNDIQFVGFDTDSNQEKARGLDIITISRDASVEEILKGEENWREWFPNNGVLMNENMMDGAGQKRVLSRLAFSDTLRRERTAMNKLDEAIEALSVEDGMNEGSALKVMVISSFAGGTGSGMFLQLPFYLRKRYKRKFGTMNIRGLFALPDIYVSNCNYSDMQIETVYANAYAALREMAAINVFCQSEDDERFRYKMEIKGLFSSEELYSILQGEEDVNEQDRIKNAVKYRPYDFLFFIDELNRNRKSLRNIEDYYDLMAQITYVQVYSPMADQMHSKEDNLIEEIITSDGEAFYGSAGSAKMVYPYEDVLRYCALRMTDDTIKDQWNALDAEYKRQNELEKEQKKRNAATILTTRNEFIIERLDTLLKNQNQNFEFLRTQLRDIEYTDETKRVTKAEHDRVDAFMGKISNHLQSVLDNDKQIKNAEEDCNKKRMNKEKMRENREKAAASIKLCETSMEYYRNTIDDRIRMVFRNLINDIMPYSFESTMNDKNLPYCINALLNVKGDNGENVACHPLAARYLLYKFRNVLNTQFTKESANLKKCNDNTKGYLKDYDDDTEGRDPASEYIKKNKRNWKAVRNDFYSRYENEIGNMEDYRTALLKTQVYSGVLERLDEFIRYYERIFDTLKQVTASNEKERKEIIKRFNAPNPCVVYVGTSEDALEGIYSEVAGNEEISNVSMYEKLHTMAYENSQRILREKANAVHTNKMKIKAAEKAEDDKAAYRVKEIFSNEIVPFFEDYLATEFSEQIDISILDALTKEAEVLARKEAEKENVYVEKVTDESVDKERKDILNSLRKKAAPYLLSEMYHERNEEHAGDDGRANTLDSLFWGINEEVASALTGSDKNALCQFFGVDGGIHFDVRADRMYSKYEIYCYRGLYSVRLSEIPQFSEDPHDTGSFYRHYAERIRKVEQGRYGRRDDASTPHLDIRWHSRKCLPMIGRNKDNLEDKRAARAMWLGILFGNFDPPAHDYMSGKKYLQADYLRLIPGKFAETVYPDPDRLECEGNDVRPGQYYEIFSALQQNSLIVEKLLKVTEPMLKKVCTNKSENYIFTGPRTSYMVKALVGVVKEETDLENAAGTEKNVNEDDFMLDETVEFEQKGLNVLEIMLRIVKHYMARNDEKIIIRDELWKIICEYTANMPDERKMTFLRRLFRNSPFIYKNIRSGNELAWNPHFALFAQELD